MAQARWASRGQERPTPREIGDEEFVTQYGQEGPDGSKFRGQPRFEQGERDLSMLVGKMTAREALRWIASHKAVSPRDAVRQFRVGTLREAGYVVTHTPGRQNPYHISVTAPDGEDTRVWWMEQGEPMLELLKEFDNIEREG